MKQQLFEIYFISRLTNEEKNHLIFSAVWELIDKSIKLAINYTINRQKILTTNFKFY